MHGLGRGGSRGHLGQRVRAFGGTPDDRRIWAAIAWRVGVTPGSSYEQRLKDARELIDDAHPGWLEVFNLIVKNGKNRRDSIDELAAKGRTKEVAKALYWKHLKKILFFFQVSY